MKSKGLKGDTPHSKYQHVPKYKIFAQKPKLGASIR